MLLCHVQEIFAKLAVMKVSSILSSRSVVISGLTFRSIVHFEFIFLFGVRGGTSFILLRVGNELPNPMCQRGHPSPTERSWGP